MNRVVWMLAGGLAAAFLPASVAVSSPACRPPGGEIVLIDYGEKKVIGGDGKITLDHFDRPQTADGSQAAEGSRAAEAPKATEGSRAASSSQSSGGSQAAEGSKAAEAPKATEGSRAASGPKGSGGPAGADAPEAWGRFIEHLEKAVTARPDDPLANKRLGIAYHQASYKHRSKGFSKMAFKYLGRAVKLAPEDEELPAYLGSSEVLVARDSWNPIKKWFWLQRGIRRMDKAVERAPNSVPVRVTRATNQMFLPRWRLRRKRGVKDLHFLEKLVRGDEARWWNTETYRERDKKDVEAEISFRLGKHYLKKKKTRSRAVGYLQGAVSILGDSSWAARAKALLSAL
ncbi:MAG: hypothetical protein ABII00_12155 [Elusimicrobiota bacterium]